jgi:hypothetical protein
MMRIDDDEVEDVDADELWIVEAQRRYDAYLKGELEACLGEDVMNRARERISQDSPDGAA